MKQKKTGLEAKSLGPGVACRKHVSDDMKKLAPSENQEGVRAFGNGQRCVFVL